MKRSCFLMIVFAFVLSVNASGQGSVWAAEPIKIGFMAPYVGVFS
jgi:hypothetical protein